MSKDAVVRARMENTLKTEVESILNQLGLNITDAINIYFQQIKMHNGLPFEVRLLNETTKEAIANTKNNVDIVSCENAEELFEELDL